MRKFHDILEPAAAPRGKPGRRRLGILALSALGVVYGDVGTSPLYAVRECFHGSHPAPLEPQTILGVLSLIVWALIIVISIKYLAYVLRADNRGEGGILALMALIHPGPKQSSRSRWILVSLGLLGAALLYGDGAITPAISVLSAIEGLEVATPSLEPFVLPITVVILVGLFAVQHRGTGRVGAIFGPIMMVWFVTLAVLGIGGLVQAPEVLAAFNPVYAVRMFIDHGWLGFAVLGAVVLVVTGAEALYADMGHFGRHAIRLAWFTLVLPALLLNYLGQGALLLTHPEHVQSPFYGLAPDWAHYPMVVLATIATIIASQAIIAGAFSLTRQAIQLGYSPRMKIVHTSAEEIGQVYLPAINWLLMFMTIVIVIAFKRSTNLAAAYGVAVTTTMVITTLLAYVVAREIWGWRRPAAIAVTSVFLTVDLFLFGSNIIKLESGGWLPVLIAAVAYLFMSTWWQGRRMTSAAMERLEVAVPDLLERLRRDTPRRTAGTAVFLSGRPRGVPPALTRELDHSGVLHETVILLTFVTRNVPVVDEDDMITVEHLGEGIHRVVAYSGFMQVQRIRACLRRCSAHGLDVDPDDVWYFAGRQIIVPVRGGPMNVWRARLYAFISRNAVPATTGFDVPHDRVIEIGVELEV